MRTNTGGVLALAALATVGFRSSPAVSADGAAGGPNACSALLLSADGADATVTSKWKVFRATRILDVRVRTVIPVSVELERDEVVVFRFTTPKGNLYQAIETACEERRDAAARRRHDDHGERPLRRVASRGPRRRRPAVLRDVPASAVVFAAPRPPPRAESSPIGSRSVTSSRPGRASVAGWTAARYRSVAVPKGFPPRRTASRRR